MDTKLNAALVDINRYRQRSHDLEDEIASLKAQLVECKKDAERWKCASTIRNFGITNWCEYGQRTSYDSFATQIIDSSIAAQKEES